MRMLFAILLILATPVGALAGPHWGRGAPPAAYGGPGRGHEGPGGYGGPGRGHEPGGYGGPGRGHEGPGGYGGPGRGYGRPEYPGPTRGYRGPPPYAGGPSRPIYGAPPYGPPGYARSQQQRARDDVRSGRRVPLPFVIERLHRSMGADYVDTREVNDPQGRPMYVLRFRRHGRYIDVPVDAETGMVQR